MYIHMSSNKKKEKEHSIPRTKFIELSKKPNLQSDGEPNLQSLGDPNIKSQVESKLQHQMNCMVGLNPFSI